MQTKRIKGFFSKQKLAYILVVTLLAGLLSPFSVAVRADGATYSHTVMVYATDSVSFGRNAAQDRRNGMQVFVRSDWNYNTETGFSATHGYVKFDLAGSGISLANIERVELAVSNNAAPGQGGNHQSALERQMKVYGVNLADWTREGTGQLYWGNAPISRGVTNQNEITLPIPEVTFIGQVQVPAVAGAWTTTDVTDYVTGRLGIGTQAFSFGFTAAADGVLRVDSNFTFNGHLQGGNAPRLEIELDGLTAVQVVSFARFAEDMASALQTINALNDVTGWDVISADIGMRFNVLTAMLGRTFADRADIVDQLQIVIDGELAAGQAGAQLRAANAAITAVEMRGILVHPALGLNLSDFNALSSALQNYVAQFIVNERPAGGFRNIPALAVMFNRAVGYAQDGGDMLLRTLDGTGSIRVLEMDVTGTGEVSIQDGKGNVILRHGFSAAASFVKAYVNLPARTYSLYIDNVLVGADIPFKNNAADRIGGIYVNGEALVSNANLIVDNLVTEGGFVRNSLGSSNEMANGPGFVAKFDVVVTDESPDGAIIFGDSAGLGEAWGQMQFIFRAGGGPNANCFNVFDGTTPGAGYIMPGLVGIEANRVFHVKMEFDLSTGLYNVWVAPAGSAVVEYTGRGPGGSFRVRNYPPVQLQRLDTVIAMTVGGDQTVFSNLVILDPAKMADALDVLNQVILSVDIGNITDSERDAFESALTAIALGLSLDYYARVTNPVAKAQLLDKLIASGPYDNVLAIQSALSQYVVALGDIEPPYWPTIGDGMGNLDVNMTVLQQALLSWDEALDDFGILFYEVWRQRASGTPELIATLFGADNTRIADSGLTANTNYTFWVRAFDYGGQFVESARITALSQDAGEFPHDREVLDDAFRIEPARFHSRRTLHAQPHPVESRPIWIQTEWYNPDYRMGEAMRYLTFIASNSDFHTYAGPDGRTTLLERVIEHFRSVLAGGNEPSVSGTGLSAHGYLPVLAAITHAKLNIPEVWDALTPEEIERADLLMKGALFSIYYAAADTGRGNRGLNQDLNYNRGWEANHRIGIMAVPLIYYYFAEEKRGFVGNGFFMGDADRGVVGWMNNFIRDFNFTVFTRQLEEAGMTMLLNSFGNAGLTETHHVASMIRPEGFTYNLGTARYGTRISVTLSDSVGDWVLAYTNVVFNGGPAIPVGGDIWRTGGTGNIFGQSPGLNNDTGGGGGQLPGQRWPTGNAYRRPNPYNVNGTIVGQPPFQYTVQIPLGFPHGYWGFFYCPTILTDPLGLFLGADALNYFPNLGAPGMGQEFDAWDAGGARSGVGYVSAGAFGGIDGLLTLMVISDNFGGLDPEVFNESFTRANVGMIDMYFKGTNNYSSFHKAVQTGFERVGGIGARMNMDLWHNLINNPIAEMAAVNSASNTADMRAAIEAPSLALVLHAYNGLEEASKDAVADAMVSARPFRTKADLQEALSAKVTEMAIVELNAATTPAEMLAKIDSPALGAWVFGWNQVTPAIPGTTDPTRRLAVAQYVLENMPDGGYLNRREVRTAIAMALYTDDLPPVLEPGVAEVNNAGKAQDLAAMSMAIANPVLDLDLTMFDMLTPEQHDEALQAIIGHVQNEGPFTTRAEVQETLDAIVDELLGIAIYTLVTTADARIMSGGNADINFGTQPTLTVRSHTDTQAVYLKFDLSGLAIQCPDDIQNVELQVFMTGITPGNWGTPEPPWILDVHRQTLPAGQLNNNNWTETGITFNNRLGWPGGSPWEHGFATNRLDRINIQPLAVNQWHSMDVTQHIRNSLASGYTEVTLFLTEGARQYGIRMSAELTFSSRENANGNAPRLEVTVMRPGETLPPGVEAVNDAGIAEDLAAMRAAITASVLGLELAVFDLLTTAYQDVVLQTVVSHILANGSFTTAEAIQTVVDDAVAVFFVVVTLPVAEDAYIESGAPDSTRGVFNPNNLMIRTHLNPPSGNSFATLLKFDLRDMAFDPADIGRVELELFMTALTFGGWGGGPGTPPPYMIAVIGQPLGPDHTWSENTVTWNNAPNLSFNTPGHPWQHGLDRLAHANPPVTTGAIDTVIFGEPTDTAADMAQYTNQWYRFNITEFIRAAMVEGDEFVTLLVFEGTLPVATTDPDRPAFSRRSAVMTFASGENPNGNGPRLQFTVFPSEELPGEPPVITGHAPDGVVNTAYSFQFIATGSPAPIWSVTGELPPGLTFENGLLSGTPTTAGNFTFTVTASNTEGTDSLIVTVAVTLPPPCREDLASAIAYAQVLNPADFTIFTWIEVYDELRNAILVYNNENATQAQIDLAESRLRARVAALIAAPPVTAIDFTALDLAIADAASREMQNYNIFTWFDLQDELVRARNVRNNPNVNQQQVDTATARLQTIINRL